MIGIDLFSGAGGLSLGAIQAGIKVAFAVEADYHAAATYSINHPNTTVYAEDIRNLKEIDIDNQGQATILFGGPPCRGFSTSNQKTRNAENPVNWLFQEFLRVVKLFQPDWVVFENVRGIKETTGGIFLQHVLSKLKTYDYTTSSWILNAADYGVPQQRVRLFVLGSLHGISVERPKPTVSKYMTVREAISDLPDLPNGASIHCMAYKCDAKSNYARLMRGSLQQSSNHLVTKNAPHIIERYKHIPQGGNWEDIPPQLMSHYTDRSRCHTGIYRRLREDTPSVVIGNYRKNMLIHPTQHVDCP